MKSLANKIALVTGASRGIGKATAIHLAQEGATVLVHFARQSEAAQQVVKEITSLGGQANSVQADISQLTGIEELFSQTDQVLDGKKLDILVNNAGVYASGSVEEITEEQYDAQFNINVKAPFFITQQALRRMNEGGRIINISSNLSRKPGYDAGAYAMTKAAIDTFTLSLAGGLGPRQITVNAIGPGLTYTDMTSPVLDNEEFAAITKQQTALRRIGRVEDIAQVVGFLASPAAGWVTGQYIETSGGFGL
jgi:NAD(P)-dependent dehydrogenase (short-subunit alcohol dehydrogenase family)